MWATCGWGLLRLQSEFQSSNKRHLSVDSRQVVILFYKAHSDISTYHLNRYLLRENQLIFFPTVFLKLIPIAQTTASIWGRFHRSLRRPKSAREKKNVLIKLNGSSLQIHRLKYTREQRSIFELN